MSASLLESFSLFPLKAQTLGQYQNHGARLANSPSETGTLLCFSPEDLLFIAVDLQEFNQGASTTNCIEYVWKYAQAIAKQSRIPAQHIRLLEIDSMGYIDEYIGQANRGAWKAFGVHLEPSIPPRTVEALSALIHDRFEPFLRFINDALAEFDLSLVPSKPPRDYPCVEGHVFLLQPLRKILR